MKLIDACRIARDCGLNTIGEAVFNIDLHAISIFSYEDITKELNELCQEASSVSNAQRILDQFPQLGDKHEEGKNL